MRKIEVVEYQSKWIDDFQEEACQIVDIVRENKVNLFHIGSTSVPQLAAKPVIDMLLVVDDITLLDKQAVAFAQLGYEVMGEFGLPGRRYFRKGGRNRTHHIHAYGVESISEITRHLAFRNYLRAHPKVALEYGELKAKLAKLHSDSIDDYGDGKDAFVRKVERDALVWMFREQK